MAMSMKAVILAAGKSERLKSVVKNVPKPMVKVAGKPILEHNIEWLSRFGVRQIAVNLHYLPQVIRDYFGDGRKWGVEIRYSYEPQLLGTAGAVRKIASQIWANEIAEPFIVAYGDNLLSDFDLQRIIEFHLEKKGIGTICLYHKNDVSQSGIAVLDGKNRIVGFVEKPHPSEVVGNLVNTGIYVLEPEILNYIPEASFSDFGKDVLGSVINAGEDLYGFVAPANLIAIDTPELLRAAVPEKTKV